MNYFICKFSFVRFLIKILITSTMIADAGKNTLNQQIYNVNFFYSRACLIPYALSSVFIVEQSHYRDVS